MTQAFNLSQLANKVNTSGQLDIATGVTGTLPSANLPTVPTSKGGTGLTTVGAAGTSLTSNGTSLSWVAAAAGGGNLSVQLFTAPGTWTYPGTATTVKVTVLGGGGGGYWNSGGGNGGTSSFGSLATATGGTTPPSVSAAGAQGTGTIPVGTVLMSGPKTTQFVGNDVINGSGNNNASTATAYSVTVAGPRAGVGASPSPGGPAPAAGQGGLVIGIVSVSGPVAVTVGVGGPKPPPNGLYAGKNGAVLVEWVG